AGTAVHFLETDDIGVQRRDRLCDLRDVVVAAAGHVTLNVVGNDLELHRQRSTQAKAMPSPHGRRCKGRAFAQSAIGSRAAPLTRRFAAPSPVGRGAERYWPMLSELDAL